MLGDDIIISILIEGTFSLSEVILSYLQSKREPRRALEADIYSAAPDTLFSSPVECLHRVCVSQDMLPYDLWEKEMQRVAQIPKICRFLVSVSVTPGEMSSSSASHRSKLVKSQTKTSTPSLFVSVVIPIYIHVHIVHEAYLVNIR